ncbi:hypothetical protein E2C01_098257 [Portunus trituberculatus]|uniref:Uncharacterized protein n=1 Tax=Portunus trituberculatus TaxID=210409 RepID=A0A5B7K0S3_PORTR|nr:hypothetical protein [Portunus trituberculatus]
MIWAVVVCDKSLLEPTMTTLDGLDEGALEIKEDIHIAAHEDPHCIPALVVFPCVQLSMKETGSAASLKAAQEAAAKVT